jgi:hypothetical protein
MMDRKFPSLRALLHERFNAFAASVGALSRDSDPYPAASAAVQAA